LLSLAAERLAGLQRELRETQNQVMEASRELNKLEQAATARKLTEAEKQKIRQRLAAKIQNLNQVGCCKNGNKFQFGQDLLNSTFQ